MHGRAEWLLVNVKQSRRKYIKIIYVPVDTFDTHSEDIFKAGDEP